MTLRVKEALDLPAMSDIKLAGGHEGVDNIIRWVHIGDTVDMAKWLHGGELLLTCAHGIKNHRLLQLRYLKELAQIDISAVGIEVGYYFDQIPEAMCSLADSLKLPLLEIPHGIPFVDLTEVILDEIFSSSRNSTRGSDLSYSLIGERDLFEDVKWGYRKKALDEMIRILDYLEEVENSKHELIELIIFISRGAIEGGGDPEACLELKDRTMQKLSGMDSFSEKRELVRNTLQEFLDLVIERHKSKKYSLVMRVKKILQKDYQENLALDEIAERVHLSSSYLSKIFKEETGMTVIEYLTQIRIKKGKDLLSKDKFSLNEIASRIGFYDASYFSRVFKKKEGKTPGQFKREVLQEK